MSLRSRLVASFALVLLVAVAVLGVVVTRSTRQALIAQVDQRLQEVGDRNPIRPAEPGGRRRPPPDLEPGRADGGGGGEPRGGSGLVEARLFAHVILAEDGTVLNAEPAGFAADPLPLPDVSRLARDRREPATYGAGRSPEGGDALVTLRSVDGDGSYRAVVIDSGGYTEVFATSLDAVDSTVAGLVRTFAFAGLAVLGAGAAATWLTVRRGLRPVDTMVDTAAAIARGERTRRVPSEGAPAELSRLAVAFNEMLDELAAAFAAESQAKASLGRFVADASHELRTPLAAVGGYAELYQSGALADPAELDRAMHRIRAESGRMRRLVDDLLALARLDSLSHAEVLGDHRPVNLAAVVRDAIADSEAIEPGRPVSLVAPATLTIHGDAGQLTQVIANLLANARTHTPPGAAVEVELDGADGLAVLTVRDHGPGLPPDQLDRVFERFWRVDRSRSRATGGTGLGLAIVAAIVAAHDGSVGAANVVGGGARFTVTLPVSFGAEGGPGKPARVSEPVSVV